jgi:hypothetical protein
MTTFNKRVMPLVLLLVLVAGVFVTLAATRRNPVLLPLALLPVLIGAIVFFVMRKLVFDLVDEVWDTGHDLIVKNDGQTERIAFANIMNLSYTVLVNPPRVTLHLRLPCRFGHEVSFIPPLRFIPFARSPLIEDLILRIDQARRGG